MCKLSYDKTISCHGVDVPIVTPRISERMQDVMASGRYERSEINALNDLLSEGDRLLEIGAGVGVVSTVAARIVGAAQVVAIEADADLVEVMKETHRINKVDQITCITGAAVAEPSGKEVPFFQRTNFWASSTDHRAGDKRLGTVKKTTPVVNLNDVLQEQRPDVIVMDIEGAELGLFDKADLSSVRAIVIELHQRVYGLKGIHDLTAALGKHGFSYDAKHSPGSAVAVFSRFTDSVAPNAPRVAAVACIKDEGPFILEWVAYHKSIGVTDLIVFTNDCTDGSDDLLERLSELGVIEHYTNPSTAIGHTLHQPIALRFSQCLKSVKNADWFISMDADEFINVHVGDGTLQALFEVLSDADAIGLTHLDFGSANIETFEEGFVTRQLKYCQRVTPKRAKRRGIKTIVRKSTKIERQSNHRPVFDDPEGNNLVWYDGGGRKIPMEHAKGKAKGVDCRGSYELVQMNHYPVKTYESYLTKVARGDAVDPRWARGIKFWEQRNTNNQFEDSIDKNLPRAQDEFDRLLQDLEISRLHQTCVRLHRQKIKELRADKSMQVLLLEMDMSRAELPVSSSK